MEFRKPGSEPRADLDHTESRTGVVAGLVPATPSFAAQSKHDRGGRDKPGHDPGEVLALQPDERDL